MRKPNTERQLDALAACIVGGKEVKRLAGEWEQTPSSLYHLARHAIKSLQTSIPK